MPPREAAQARRPRHAAAGFKLYRLIVFVSVVAIVLVTSAGHLDIPFFHALRADQRAKEAFRHTGMAPTVAVVGTGLAGLSAAYELSVALHAELPEARVIVMEKNKMVGGNSMKASSGINAVNPAAGDTQDIYAADTKKSGGGLSKEDLVAQLVVRALVSASSSSVSVILLAQC